jgi:gluconokinase
MRRTGRGQAARLSCYWAAGRRDHPFAMFVVLMGVAGSGKSTVGRLLASALGWSFYDADDLHSADNVRKMAAGIPLTDEDRRPWLMALRNLIAEHAARKENAVLACSALKRTYREVLTSGNGEVVVIYLKADADLIRERLAHRRGHYMPVQLLESQFETLEEPEDAMAIPAEWPPHRIVKSIRAFLRA